MNRIDRTKRARVDLQQIWSFVAEKNFPAADKLLIEIDAAIQRLARNPYLGEAADYLVPGSRRFTIKNYLIFFEPLSDGIRVLRVYHSARRLDDLAE